ncbi:hypothetical protein B0H14DRAFT_2641021 [Mycena olivaceomarginata]|nr:hypothetical protein B0H14DRAFT_2641021 [Mycena olivaceomarginata]
MTTTRTERTTTITRMWKRNFLDDREQPDNVVIRVCLVDAHEHEREHTEALRLAAHYDEAAAEFYWREDRVDEFPVVPGTWVQAGVRTCQSKKTQTGIAFVLLRSELYQNGCTIQAKRPVGTDGLPAFKKAQYPRAYPSRDELLRLSAASIRIYSCSPTMGLLPALVVGDRVVVVAGEHRGVNGFITALISRCDSETHEVVRHTKVIPPGPNRVYPGPNRVYNQLELKAKKPKKNKDKKQDGVYANFAHLKCSGLDLCFQFKIGDRASVVGGILYSGVTGQVERVEDGGSLLISIPHDTEVVGSTTISPGLEDHKIFTILIKHSQSLPVESESEHLLGGIPNPGLLEVHAADLEFDPSSFTSNVAADLPLRALLPPTPEEFSQHHAAAWPQYTRPSNSRVYQDPQLRNPAPVVGEFAWGQKSLMYTGAQYARRHFQVVVRGKHQWKGLRGEVIGDYDSPKRASELAKWMTEFDYTKSSSVFNLRKGGEDASWKKNQEEIFVTIKEIATNNTVSGIPLKNVYHEPRSDWGMDHLRKISQGMAALEGKCGWLLLANPPPLNEPKIEVFGVGKNGMKHKIERGCIKPHRKDDTGKELWETTVRVIILGPDIYHNTAQKGRYALTLPELVSMHGPGVVPVRLEGGQGPLYFYHNTAQKGRYALTLPELVSMHGPGVVPVRLEGGQGPLYFPAWSLALAKNVKVQALHGVFDVTSGYVKSGLTRAHSSLGMLALLGSDRWFETKCLVATILPVLGLFTPPQGPFRRPWAAPIQTLSTGLPRGHVGTSGAALAQPVLAILHHTGPFLQALDCSSSPYPLACSGGMWDAWHCACTARFGDFALHAGPILQGGGRPIPYPFGCLQLCLHSFFWFLFHPATGWVLPH